MLLHRAILVFILSWDNMVRSSLADVQGLSHQELSGDNADCSEVLDSRSTLPTGWGILSSSGAVPDSGASISLISKS